jgi:hypothetical protein
LVYYVEMIVSCVFSLILYMFSMFLVRGFMITMTMKTMMTTTTITMNFDSAHVFNCLKSHHVERCQRSNKTFTK